MIELNWVALIDAVDMTLVCTEVGPGPNVIKLFTVVNYEFS
jgi:hypothetical protein